MNPLCNNSLFSKRQQGFSLVEVVLSIGIISFAFVGLLALLPTGLGTFRQAVDISVGSQIVQRVVTEAQQTDFELLFDSGSSQKIFPIRYFNDQGDEVPQAQAIYYVKLVTNRNAALPGGDSNNLASLTIDIANNPGNLPIAIDPQTGGFGCDGDKPLVVSRYCALVAKTR